MCVYKYFTSVSVGVFNLRPYESNHKFITKPQGLLAYCQTWRIHTMNSDLPCVAMFKQRVNLSAYCTI